MKDNKEIVAHIKVVVTNIEVDDKYYSFDYRVWKDGEVVKSTRYSNDHSRRDDKEEFKKDLENGYAIKCALESVDF